MRYVIIRDDDTNGFTPIECLERLYRPFLERGLPINLAVIPGVRTNARRADGLPERFLFGREGGGESTMPIGDNGGLVRYLQDNAGFHIAQHGCEHSLFEFDSPDCEDIDERLERGASLLAKAGLGRPRTFVAPQDRFSRLSVSEVAKRFRVISTGWFELERLPVSWWPKYALKKVARTPHWRVGGTTLLSHPGCLLSYLRPRAGMLADVKQMVSRRRLTVLVTHWWEYFPDGEPDAAFIQALHQIASWLAAHSDVTVTSFDDLIDGNVPLN